MSARFPCPRCGDEQAHTVITSFSDPEPRFIQTFDCPCPRPRCPFCHGTLDWAGRCPTVGCFMLLTLVPIQEIA